MKTLECSAKLADIVRRIAYPNRGTADEDASIQDFANEIQASFELSDLELWSSIGVENAWLVAAIAKGVFRNFSASLQKQLTDTDRSEYGQIISSALISIETALKYPVNVLGTAQS